MMWLQDATKTDLLNIVQSDRLADRPLRQVRSIYELPESSTELQFLWREDPREWGKLPSIIIVDKMDKQDFFAWTGTYLPYCRPLTALCRVISRDTLKAVVDAQVTFGLGALETTCIGLIIGEAATYVAGQSNVNRLSIAAFTGTYSFAMTRAIAGNMLPIERNKVGELWSKARRLTGQRLLSLSLSDLNQVWSLVFSFPKHKSFGKWYPEDEFGILTLACRQIFQTGEIGENTWQSLTCGIIDNQLTDDLFKGPREGRVMQVERVLASLSQQTTGDKMIREFVGGYLASRLAPGTFDHHELLIPYLPKLPSLLLWYGLCAGLSSDSKLRNFGAGIGRRIIREAVQEENILNRPRCDIALEELEVLSSGKNQVQNFHTKESGYLIVEIFPCINCTMRNTEQFDLSRLNQIQQKIIIQDNRESELRNLLLDLDRSLNSIDRIRNRISSIIGNGEQRQGRGKKGKN